jgi:O-antigen/teichoic acid export membrane protein
MQKVFSQFRQMDWRNLAQNLWLYVTFLSTQVGVQFLNMVTGFLVVRTLNKDEYADYTIVNTLVPAILMLSDNGIGTGIAAVGRIFWEDDLKMGRLVNTGLLLRRRFALVSFALLAPVLAWMLHYRAHVSIALTLLLTTVALTGVSFQITSAVMRMVLDLRQKLRSLGKVSLGVAGLRLLLVVIFVNLFHFTALLAMLATTASVIFETYYYSRTVKAEVKWDAPPDPEYYPQIFSIVKRTMPLTVYFCLQSQLTVWLMSIFGSSHQVADIGAASRLSVIFATLLGSFGTIAVPRFARANGRKILTRKVYEILGVAVVMLASLILFTWLFPQPFVLLLGPNYYNMTNLIWLVVLSTGSVSLAALCYGLNMCKGWIPPAYVTIPVEFVTQITLLHWLDLSKTANVLIFTCLGTIPPTVVILILLFRRIRAEPDEPTSHTPFSAENMPSSPEAP